MFMGNKIRTFNLNGILKQSGFGIPNHMAPKGSEFTDIDTTNIYTNVNGVSGWKLINFTGTSGANTYITGGTYNSNTDIMVLNRNDATTVDISGLTDTYITGGTYNSNTDIMVFTNNGGGTFNISGDTQYFDTSMNFVQDATVTTILFKDVTTGNILRAEAINSIQAVANGVDIRIQRTGGEEIFIDALDITTTYIDGVLVSAVLATAKIELNTLFANAGGLVGNLPVFTSSNSIALLLGNTINHIFTGTNIVALEVDISTTGTVPAGAVTKPDQDPRRIIGGSTLPVGVYTVYVTAYNYFGQTTQTLTITVSSAFTNTKSFWGGTTAASKRFLTDTTLGYQVSSPLFRASNSTGLASDSTKAWSVVLWQKSANTTGWNALFGAGATRQNRTWAGFDVYSEGDATYTTIRINYGHKWSYIYTDFKLLGTSILDWKQIVVTYNGGDTLFSTNPTGQAGSEACFQVYVNGANVPQTTSYSVTGFDGAINANGFSGFHVLLNPRIARTQYVSSVFTSKELYVDEVGFYDYTLTPTNVVDIWDGGTPQSLDGITGIVNPVDYFRCGDGVDPTNPSNTDLLNFPVMYNYYSGRFNMEAQNMTVADYVSDVP